MQISIDEDTLHHVDRALEPLGVSPSEIVRQALREWLRRRSVGRFEEEWIAAVRERPDEASGVEAWLPAQTWSRN